MPTLGGSAGPRVHFGPATQNGDRLLLCFLFFVFFFCSFACLSVLPARVACWLLSLCSVLAIDSPFACVFFFFFLPGPEEGR